MKRYKNRRTPVPWLALVGMTAVSLSLWMLSGAWYTTARAAYLTPSDTAVPMAGARPLEERPDLQAAYGVLSAAAALDGNGTVTGYVLITAKTGYKSTIRVQSTFTADGKRLAAIRVLSQNETEYLGTRVASESFTAGFAGRRLPVKLWPSAALASPVDGLSGSTVSAQAVVTAVNNAHQYLKAYLAR